MAAATAYVEVDTSRLQHFSAFMDASLALDQLLDLPIEPEPGALAASMCRWREALHLVHGETRLEIDVGTPADR